MTENLAPASNRRKGPRFSKNAPLSVLIGDREIPAYTRDLSNKGVYFYLDISHSDLVERDFDFMVKFPPEVTISTYCSILGRGRLLRRENISGNLTGIAAEILQYSILRDQRLEFAQPEYAMVN
jgi:PilZ domain